MHYHVSQGGVNIGKYSESDIRMNLASGRFGPADHYWCVGMPGWKTLAEFRPTGNQASPTPPLPYPTAGGRGPTNPAHQTGTNPEPYARHPTAQPSPMPVPTDRIKIYGYIGGGLLALGTFGPVIEFGRLGYSLIHDGNTQGVVVLACGAAGAAFSHFESFKLSWIPAGIATLILGDICLRLSDAPTGNFFGSPISIMPGWGLMLMLIGNGFLVASAWKGSKANRP